MTKTQFGFKTVAAGAKQPMVDEVFHKVAKKYDIMNDIMSLGLHRLWKDEMMQHLRPFNDRTLLDVATGTMDIARRFIERGGEHATATDINEKMLEEGKRRLQTFAQADKITVLPASAEELPFAAEEFDYYTISFGIRNVPDIEKALLEARRVLKFGGKFICLEFSDLATNSELLQSIYNFYLLKMIPKVGSLVAKDEAAYRYLGESILKFPKAPVFAKMLEKAGFTNVHYKRLCGGVVAIHTAYAI